MPNSETLQSANSYCGVPARREYLNLNNLDENEELFFQIRARIFIIKIINLIFISIILKNNIIL